MIEFNSENNFVLKNRNKVKDWLLLVTQKEGKELGELGYVFCSDEYLYNINIEYLNHDTFTDIITFDYCTEDIISGEIYISTDRVAENGKVFNVKFTHELARVMVHGLLHLCGYPDETLDEKRTMRGLEDKYIAMIDVDFLYE